MLTRVLIVDDHAAVRSTLRALLGRSGEVEVVGAASGGGEALLKIRELQPDVVILDLMMPDIDGFEVLDALKTHAHRPKVVVLSMNDSPSTRERALAEGASAFVSKRQAHRKLLQAVNKVME